MAKQWLLIVFLAINGYHQSSNAWGKIGHEAAAVIAEQNLDVATLNKISKILQGSSMAIAANWPDSIKKTPEWIHTSPYHYTKVTEGDGYFDSISTNDERRKFGDVVRALVKAEDILRSPSSTLEQQKYALSFLIHFMADLHQPLHTGRAEDRGGNDVPVTYFNLVTNLHAVWDSGIIKAFLTSLIRIPNARPETENYLSLLQRPATADIKTWQNSYILDWLADSMEKRAEIYAYWKNDSQAYQTRFENYMNKRVLMGGYRMAAWLNAIFAGKPFQPVKMAQLRKSLLQSFGGQSSNQIILEPQTITKAKRLEIEEYIKFWCNHDHEEGHVH